MCLEGDYLFNDKLIVKINSKQKGSKQNTIKMKALANSYEKKGILYVIYKESLDENIKVSTMLKITKDSLTLDKNGQCKTTTIFLLR